MKFMMKRMIAVMAVALLLVSILSTAVLASDGQALTSSASSSLKDLSFEDLAGMTAGVKDGTIHDQVLSSVVPDAKFSYYKTLADECIALEQGKVDYVLVVEEQYSYIADQYEDLITIPQLQMQCGEIGYIFSKDAKGDALRAKIDAYIIEIGESGELKKLQDYWFSAGTKEVVDLPATGENGVLKLASPCASPPFIYIENNKYTGFEMAVLAGFCREYGYGIDVNVLDFSGVLPAVKTGKCDFAAACLMKTAERMEEVNFSETTSQPMYTILMRTDKAASFAGVTPANTTSQKSFFEKISNSFYKTFITENRWQMILQGCAVTVLLTLLSGTIALFLGLQVYKVRVCKSRVCRKLIGGFNSIMGGTPMVVLLLIFYYIIFGMVNIPAFVVATIAFALNMSSSISEIYYTTINSIDKGQLEAALALGYSEKYAFHRFILPQALTRAIPLIKGQMIALLKGTAIVGFISLQDLTKMGDLIRSRTYDAFFPLITVAVIYFIIAWLIRLAIGWIADRLDPIAQRNRRIAAGKDKKGAGI